MNNIYKRLASFYDKLYGDKFYKDYANFIKKIIEQKKIKNVRILDIACGTGRLIEKLTGEKIKIEGVEASKEMLSLAQKRNKKIKFYNQEFVKFYTGGKYNVITCTFDSINYIINKRDLYKTIKNINRHLDSGGFFIFDFNTIYKKVKEKFVKNEVLYINTIRDKYWDIQIIIKRGRKAYKERHLERLYSFGEMKPNLAKNGFRITEFYSKFNKKINQPDKYQRLIIVARKIN